MLSRGHQNLSLTNAAVEHHQQQQHESPQSALLTEYMQLHHTLHQATSQQQQLQFSVKTVNVKKKISSLHADTIKNGAKRGTGTALLIQLQVSGQINLFRRSCLSILDLTLFARCSNQ
jgi:hypothetical protein